MNRVYDNNIVNINQDIEIPINYDKYYLKWEDGSEYIGNFIDNIIQGFGVYRFPDGSIYEGSWKNNCKHGIGKLLFNNGNIYNGEFLDDNISGYGSLLFNNNGTEKQLYIGNFYKGRREGYGKLYYYNIDTNTYKLKYIGNWIKDDFSDIGICYHDNGNKFYEGYFVKGLPSGDGILYDIDGSIAEKGYYIKGELQKNIDNKRTKKVLSKIKKYIKFPFNYIL